VNIHMSLEGLLDPATSSRVQFGQEIFCLSSSKRSESSTERLSSLQRQLKAYSAVISHWFVLGPFVVPCDDIAGKVSRENARFM
jgi:hypothetical protein